MGRAPPASADNTLQYYVSDLRGILGHDAIRLNGHAYELDIDVEQFEQLVHRAATSSDDPDERLHLSRAALELWRGRPFGDLGDEDAFLLEAHRLDDGRLRLAGARCRRRADARRGGGRVAGAFGATA